MNITRAARQKLLSIRFLALALFLCATWQPAAAALPGATGTFNTNVSNSFFVFPASASFACGTAAISATPLPALSVTGSDCSDGLQAILSYYFQIAGPAGTLVPISVASTHSLAANGSAQAGFSLTVANQTIDIGNCYFANLAACGVHDSVTTLSLMSNQIYGVTMMTAMANNLGPGAATAFLDPRFDFASGFAAAGYAFEFSPGIGNGVGVAAVPEPESWLLLLAGLTTITGVARRRPARR